MMTTGEQSADLGLSILSMQRGRRSSHIGRNLLAWSESMGDVRRRFNDFSSAVGGHGTCDLSLNNRGGCTHQPANVYG